MNEKRVTIPMKLGLAGRFRLEACKPDGSRRLLADWFDNNITDGGLERMGTGGVGTHCHVGTGSTAPANSDSQMETFVAATNTVQETTTSHDAGTPFFVTITRRYRFAEGEAEGNLSEVGVGWAGATSGPLFSRELIRDGAGDPTTITVLSDEFLDVTYQLQITPPQSDVTDDVVDSGPAGTTHGFTIRASELSLTGSTSRGWCQNSKPFADTDPFAVATGGAAHRAYTGAIGSITERPAGSFDDRTSADADAYVGSSLERTWSITYGLDDANFNIQSVVTAFGVGQMQVEFDPVIPKTDTDVLTIGFKVSWARAT